MVKDYAWMILWQDTQTCEIALFSTQKKGI